MSGKLRYFGLDAPTVRYLEEHGWDTGRPYSFPAWIKSCGGNVGTLKVRGSAHLRELPAGHWQDGEWVSEEGQDE